MLGGDYEIVEHLTCSPDGKRLAFPRRPPSPQTSEPWKRPEQLSVVNVDGTNLRQLTSYDTGSLYYPVWSPDGKHIAFEHGARGGIKALTIVSVDDGVTRDIVRGGTPEDRFFGKSWSPDGKYIAFPSGAGESVRTLTLVSVDDGATREIFRSDSPQDSFSEACWSRDGSRIASLSGGDRLRIGQIGNGQYDTFGLGIEGPTGLRWSPDETKMLFCTWVDTKQLAIMENFLPAAVLAAESE